MDIRRIKTEADYDRALREIERYFEQEPKPGTDEARRFDILADLVKQYEDQHYPIQRSCPDR